MLFTDLSISRARYFSSKNRLLTRVLSPHLESSTNRTARIGSTQSQAVTVWSVSTHAQPVRVNARSLRLLVTGQVRLSTLFFRVGDDEGDRIEQHTIT